MFFREVIDLISVTRTQDDYGDFTETETTNTVYADKKSIRQSEFYQAMTIGIRPEISFIIREVDYNDEDKLQYNSKKYDIIRTYSIDGELIELICKGYSKK